MTVNIISIIILGCSAFFQTQFGQHVHFLQKEAVVGWKEEFVRAAGTDAGQVPQGWKLAKKPGTRPAMFTVISIGPKAGYALRMEADRASSSLMTQLVGVDIKKTPFLRWRWKASVLPESADGRFPNKDDQAIGIYVGSGSALNNKSVSYRWDTETPKGSAGNSSYGLGGVKVKWYTLRNKEDSLGGKWIEEERNVAKDFMESWGFLPDKIYLAVSCNSQYTSSRSAAELSKIGFYDK